MTDRPAPGGSGVEASGAGSIGVGGNVGVAVTGDGARLVMLPGEAVRWAKDVDAPPGAANVPGSASGVFVGREDELARLHRLLTDVGEAAVTQVPGTRAIHGLGGIGKSTLALHYAHTHRHAYTLVWWLNAETTDRIVTSLGSLAMRLCPQWAAAADVQERAAWAILWLQWHPGWLLIFDNVEHPDELRHYLGALPDGRHLATSRTATGWHAIAPTMPLGLLDADAAISLLCTLALGEGRTPTPHQREMAGALAADLGHLPLALEQAGAYLFETGTSLADYRTLLGQVMDTATAGIDPERTIARIWRHTLTAIERRNPQAVILLDAMAWLAPDDIPRTLLAPLCSDIRTLGEALGVLHSYNMISYSADRQKISVHRLVQAVLRTPSSRPGDRGPQAGRGRAEQAVVHALAPPPGQDTASEAQWDALIPHLIALAATTPSGDRDDPLADWYEAAALRMHEQGHSARTIPLYRATLTQRERVLGDTHPDTLTSRSDLAAAYDMAGDLERAVPLCETTLAQRVQVLGDTHPDTLRSRSNLALVYQAAGDLGRAVPLHETTLAQCEQVLGYTHPDTLASRSDLALAYQVAGDLGRAIPLTQLTLAQRERVLGDSHPDTLRSRSQLAWVYQLAGDLGRAVSLHETVLGQRVRVLGDTHPDTLASRDNLALTCQVAGDLGRAVSLHETVLAQRERVLGNTHPDTLVSRSKLAVAYQVVGDLERAVPLSETTLAQRERVLGDSHPDTLRSRGQLAWVYQLAGDLGRAVSLHETVLAQRVRVLGDTHPDTLASRGDLAGAYQTAGDLERAVPLLETVLAQCEQVLGDTHPDTLISRNHLAWTYVTTGNLKRAVPLGETSLAQHERVLGDTHPDTLNSRDTLAYAYVTTGDLKRALPLCELTLAQRARVLGDTHPDTLHSRNTLAYACRVSGDLGRAIPLYEATLDQREQVLGDSHLDTLHSRHQLAWAYVVAGDLKRALPLCEATLAQYERVLGDTHPDTLNSRFTLDLARETPGQGPSTKRVSPQG
ncbi:tetratricopeptide repeat protein [Streptomyces sp. NBC_00287]|uniref:tetratricopeptide repeat protein n=1 Tax=Streptomyces sp. NBC_00287 TaxID=2975702 RepID=UPI002E2E6F6B|nr:tetratricopeptide repeat protein [Streptomyces sp. NBC_00287]